MLRTSIGALRSPPDPLAELGLATVNIRSVVAGQRRQLDRALAIPILQICIRSAMQQLLHKA